MQEIWKDIVGFEGFYQVSNLGKVRSLERKCSNGRTAKGKILKPSFSGRYAIVVFTKGSSKSRKGFSLHKLVLSTFSPCENKNLQVNHKDGDKSNNNLINLEWMSAKENCLHSWKNGTTKKRFGEEVGTSKLTLLKVFQIRSMLGKKSQRDIAKLFGISFQAVSLIKLGKIWSQSNSIVSPLILAQ